jgi:hypothetical protein
LPSRDRRCISFEPDAKRAFAVSGDPGRLTFLLRSMLAYLLRIRPDENSQIAVALGAGNGRVTLDLHLSPEPRAVATEAREQTDALWQAYKTAEDDASLGLTTLEAIVEAHGGKLAAHPAKMADGAAPATWIGFDMTLPHTGLPAAAS